MKVIVFGASGSVGIEIVKQGLQRGLSVTAFVRNPEKFPLHQTANLTIVKGDVFNPKEVKVAIAHQDAVLCALGDGSIGKVRATGTQHIINAMWAANVRRLICQTTLGMGASYANLNFFWKRIMFGLILKKAFKDHQLQEQYVFKSGLDYTLVRPSALTDGAMDDDYEVGFDGVKMRLTLKISRRNVANFMLNQLTDSTYLKRAVGISK